MAVVDGDGVEVDYVSGEEANTLVLAKAPGAGCASAVGT